MQNTWPDLTQKIEPIHRQALAVINQAAAAVDADWFLTGAMARDWVFTLIHGIDTVRATNDADIGIAVADWDAFEQLRNHILSHGEFKPGATLHRLDHQTMAGFHIDLVPFGRIGTDKAKIAWPPTQDMVMNVMGLEEAFGAAVTVIAGPDLHVKVASPCGQMLMKLFAWEDRKHLQPKGKDAHDIRLLLTNYERVAGKALHDTSAMAAEDFIPEHAAARLLGQDVGALLTPVSRNAALNILDRELADETVSLLIEQLTHGARLTGSIIDDDFQKLRGLLRCYRTGLDDAPTLTRRT